MLNGTGGARAYWF